MTTLPRPPPRRDLVDPLRHYQHIVVARDLDNFSVVDVYVEGRPQRREYHDLRLPYHHAERIIVVRHPDYVELSPAACVALLIAGAIFAVFVAAV